MDKNHINRFASNISTKKCHKLAATADKVLHDKYDLWLYRQGETKGVAEATVVRYRNGFLNESEGYKLGPPQKFVRFVSEEF